MNNAEITLRSLPSEQRFTVLRIILAEHFGYNLNYARALQITYQQLDEIPSFFEKYVLLFKEFMDWWFSLEPSQLKEVPTENIEGSDETHISNIKLLDIEVEPQFYALKNLLLNRLGNDVTLEEISNISDEQLLSLAGMGLRKVYLTRSLLKLFGVEPIDETSIKKFDMGCYYKSDANESDDSDEYTRASVDNLVLNDKEKRHIGYVKKELGESITIGDVIKLDVDKLRRLPTIGSSKIQYLKKLIVRISQREVILNQCSKSNENEDFNSDDSQSLDAYDPLFVEEILLDRLRAYTESLNDRQRHIWLNRIGINKAKRTLEETAQTMPGNALTRERVRQIESKLITNWVRFSSLAPTRLWFMVREQLSLLRNNLLPTLRLQFTSDLDFYDFIALSCKLAPNDIRQITYPPIKTDLLELFWAEQESPCHLDILLGYLREELSCDDAIADNVVYRAIESEKLKLISDNQVAPRNLSKSLAFINTLLDYPDGARWEEIQSACSERNICRTELPDDRLDAAASAAIDLGFVYQSGRGEYTHEKFLTLTNDFISTVLCDVKRTLESLQSKGIKAMHLMTDFYQLQSYDKDYFIIRHIVRSFGEQYGVFFRGKSGADTVSLKPEFELVSQEKALIYAFQFSSSPMSKSDVAKHIRSESIGHASMYLDKLINSGHVVYIGNQYYASTDKFYKNVDVELVIKTFYRLFKDENRAIASGYAAKSLNRALGRDDNQYFYYGLLKNFSRQFGYQWFFDNKCIGIAELKYKSVSSAIHCYIESGDSSPQKILTRLSEDFLLLSTSAKLAVSNVLAERNRKGNL